MLLHNPKLLTSCYCLLDCIMLVLIHNLHLYHGIRYLICRRFVIRAFYIICYLLLFKVIVISSIHIYMYIYREGEGDIASEKERERERETILNT